MKHKLDDNDLIEREGWSREDKENLLDMSNSEMSKVFLDLLPVDVEQVFILSLWVLSYQKESDLSEHTYVNGILKLHEEVSAIIEEVVVRMHSVLARSVNSV